MTTLISADVSEFQVPVDDSYTRRWLIVRCCDGDYVDHNGAHNAAWCRSAVAAGRMDGWTAYVVYRPGKNADILDHLAEITPLDHVMIDVESWNGAIRGDHSDEISSLAESLSHIVGQSRVSGYGNMGDLNSIWPRRPAWVGMHVAGYAPSRPPMGGRVVGWQYTNGVENHTANPSSSSPFGHADHNEMYLDALSPEGGGTLITPTVPVEDDMAIEMIRDAGNGAVVAHLGGGVLEAVAASTFGTWVNLGRPVTNLDPGPWKDYTDFLARGDQSNIAAIATATVQEIGKALS